MVMDGMGWDEIRKYFSDLDGIGRGNYWVEMDRIK